MLYMPLSKFRDEVKDEVKKDLKEAGIKCKPKKRKPYKANSEKQMTKIFNTRLAALRKEKSYLQNSVTVYVPSVLVALSNLITKDLKEEGLFRIDIDDEEELITMKQILEQGGRVSVLNKPTTHYAAYMKEFLNELTEPIIPSDFHDALFQAVTAFSGEEQVNMVLLCILMLPDEHLDTLLFLLDLFSDVVYYSNKNKMTMEELSACIGPVIFRISPKNKKKLANVIEIMTILIKNKEDVGKVPQNIVARMDIDAIVMRRTMAESTANLCVC